MTRRSTSTKRRRSLTRVTAASLFLPLSAALLAARPSSCRAEVITPQMQTDDPRLAKPVHPLYRASISVNALLQQMTADTGVNVTVHGSPRGPSETTLICVLLRRGTSLVQEMNALCSLLSYEHAQWRWTRESGGPGNYTYVLWPSAGTDALLQEERQHIQADFKSQDAKMQAALQMSPDQVRDAAKDNPYLSDLVTSRSLSATANDAIQRRQRLGLQVFFSLPPSDRLRAMRGETVTVPFSSLPQQTLAQIAAVQTNSYSPTGKPEGTGMSFFVPHGPQDADILAPILYAGIPSMGAYNLIGNLGVDKQWKQNLADLWWIKGDVRTVRTAEDQPLKRPEHPTEPPKQPDGQPSSTGDIDPSRPAARVFSLLWRLSEASQATMMAIAPLPPPPGVKTFQASVDPLEAEEVEGKTLADALAFLRKPSLSFQHKWRDGVLLLRDPSAPFHTPPGEQGMNSQAN